MTTDDETDETDDEIGGDEDSMRFGQLMLDIAEAEAQDFEHHRVLTAVRQKLLGVGSPLHIHGRYRVDRRLGSGGMGDVYLCHDESLNRQVAVKFVRGLGSSHDQTRLRREAETLGPLSHSNIVMVHDVGEHEGRTFLAMEYVEGQTLAQWLETRRRRWREVLDTFIKAGRGLAAAHRAGVVHRDFKPANVLIRRDGEVKVADFGLALVEGRLDPRGDEMLSTVSASPGSRSSVASAAGTYRYMPLEQLEGLSVDARSDQFSFCLALYEVLWGEPPFADADLDARRKALSHDEPKVPSRGHWLWRVIRRGLARNPDERWPSMDALLDTLERVLRRRRRIAGSSVVLVMGFGLGIAVVEARDVCKATDQELAGVWDDHRRDELEQHFATLQAGHVVDSSERVLAGLDEWATAWLAERDQVCRAQDARTEDRSALIRRDECLDRQREHVERLVGMLVQADAALLAEAVVVVDALPEPSSCIDEPAVQLELVPPALAGRVAEVREAIERARTHRLLGRLEQAHDMAEAANAAALALDYGPVQAEARAELAKAEDEAGLAQQSADSYDQAIELADIHHHDRLVAQLRIERAELSLFHLRDLEHGKDELRRAETAYARAGGTDAWARARLNFGQGRLAELSPDHAEAQTKYREAVALARESDNGDLPDYLGALARVVDSKDEALTLRREAVEFAQRHWGPRHPRTAKTLFELGRALLEVDRGGEQELEAAVEIWTEVHQRAHPSLAKAHFLLGRAALKRDALDDAEAHARLMAAIQEQVPPKRDSDRGEPEQLLATIESLRGNHEAALTYARAAHAFFVLEGPGDPSAWSMRLLIVDELLALGRLDEVEAELGYMPAIEPADPNRAVAVHVQRAELAVRRGQLEEADRELSLVAALEVDDLGSYEFRNELLRALVDLRLGRLEPGQVERMRSARERSQFTDDQLSAWFEELALMPSERGRLALD